MKKSKKDDFYEIFSTQQTCDFCLEDNYQIIKITILPIFVFGDEKMLLRGYTKDKKCVKCVEEDLE